MVPMAKVEIIGPKNRFFDVVSLLHEEGKVHIEDLSKKIRSGELPLEQMRIERDQDVERERMEELLIRVRSILKALHMPDTEVDPIDREKEYARLWDMGSKELAEEVTSVIGEVEERTSTLAASQADIEAEMQLLARYEPILQKIQPLARQIVTTGNFESVALLIERRYKSALESLKDELDKITRKQCEIVSTGVDDETTAAIVVFAKAYSEAVHKFLAMENVNQIRLPEDFEHMPFDAAYEEIKRRRASMPKDLAEVREELDKMSRKWYLRLSTIRDVLTDKLQEIEAIPHFGQTEYAFVITGWIPVGDLKDLERSIREQFGTDVIVNQVEIDEHELEETPVALKNPKPIAPFQTLLSVYGMPRYGTLDATILLFLFYPLFFGMIVGDMGYGLIMLGLVLWLRFSKRDNDAIQLATSILGPATTMVVIFGFIYGEMFGNVPHLLNWVEHGTNKWFGLIPTFNRVELIIPFMFVAIGVGVVQVITGLVLGVINGLRTKHKKHVYEKGGILGILLSLGVAVLLFVAEGAPDWVATIVGLGGVVLGLGFAMKGGGVMGVVETIESVAHMASYIRIMAVGLAGAIFADAVNGIATEYGIFIGAIVGLLLHSLNLVIAAFSPTIHAIRLNFLEFFGKFYEAGGEQYRPFQKTRGEKSA